MATDKRKKGSIGEMKSMSKLMEMGYIVSKPLVETRYDFVVDFEEELKKVQAKAGWVKERDVGGGTKYLNVQIMSTWNNSNGKQSKKYEPGSVDAFTVYNPESDKVYWFEYEEVPDNAMKRSMNTLDKHLVENKL